jgi:hypothetical protein
MKIYFTKRNAGYYDVAFTKKARLPGRIAIFIFMLAIIIANSAQASTYYLTFLGSGAAQNPANWNSLPVGGGVAATNFSTSGDKFIIPVGITGIATGNWVFGNSTQPATMMLDIEGTLTINAEYSLVLAEYGQGANRMIVNGTINFMGISPGRNQLLGSVAGKGSPLNNTVNISSGATINTMNKDGVMSYSTGSINAKFLTVSLSPGSNYDFREGSQVMNGLPAELNNLKLAGGENSIKILTSSINIKGTLTIATSITLAYGNNEGKSITLEGTSPNTLINKGIIDMSGGNHAHVLKITAPLVASFGTLIPGSGTVEYNATGAQLVNGVTYYGLTLSGSGSKIIGAGTVVNGTLSIQGTAKATSTPVVYGDAGVLEYRGSSAQTMSDIEFPATKGPSGLTVYNPFGVSMTGSRTLTGVLTLISGNLSLGPNTLTMENTGDIAGGSSLSFVYTNSTGGLKWKNVYALSSRFFPVGYKNSINGYVPVKIMPAAGSVISDYTILAVNEASAQGREQYASFVNSDQVVKCIWNISKSNPGYAGINLQFQWNAFNEASNFNHNDCILSQFENNKWSFVSGPETASGSNPYTITFNDYEAGLTYFAISNPASPLPVKLMTFTAAKEDLGAVIDWVTASEKNNKYFSIEKSMDGVNFQAIGTKNGAGNTMTVTPYEFVDQDLEPGINYYRLKQTDFSGDYTYSKIIAVDNSLDKKPVVVYPTQATSTINIANQENSSAMIQLVDMAGNLIYTGSVGARQNQSLPTADIPRGVYSVNWINNETVVTEKIIIR